MRTIALFLLLLGVLSYLFPYAREAFPFRIALQNGDLRNAAIVLVVAGLVALVWSRT